MTTGMASLVDAAGSGAKLDSCAKRLLSFKSVVAWVLKYAVKEFSHLDVEYIAENCISDVSVSEKAVDQDRSDRLDGDEMVEAMDSGSVSINEGAVYYDLRLKARVPGDDEDIFLIVNLEVQNDDNLKYSLVTRGIYYAARMISEQNGTVFTNMDYQKIRKVYSIWICPEKAGRKNDGIVRYSITKEDVLGKSFIREKNYDKMVVEVIKLGKDSLDPRNPLIGLLSTIFSETLSPEMKKRILEERYGIAMTKELESEVNEMCNLSTAILNKGLRTGLEEGRKEGLSEGLRKGSLITLFDLVADGLLTVETAARRANMTEEEFLEKKGELGK